ncbi:MAG: sulfotransferase family protein [Jiangellaceae bacterium]
MIQRSPFPFLVGCGRSGTTLLRAMCDSHPELAVPPESHFVVPLAPHARTDGSFDADSFVDRLYAQERFRLWELDRGGVAAEFDRSPPQSYPDAVRTVFALWAAGQGKQRYADKTPGYVLHIPMLAGLFPEAVFVHLVRDGRDVASSFRDLGWAHTVEDAALHWKLRVRRGRRAGRALPAHRYHELSYEDLIGDPERSLRRLCEVTVLRFAPEMLEHHRHAAEVVRTTSHPGYHRHLIRPPTEGLRDWRSDLSAAEVERFELVAGDLLREFGYEPSGRRPSARARVAVAAAQARWQLHRAARRAGLTGRRAQ